MSDPLLPSSHNSKLNSLNRRILEIKKKIQLSEGQRKATFEECDAKKRENAERIAELKGSAASLRLELVKAKNTDAATERVAGQNEANLGTGRQRLDQVISKLENDNVRLRRKLDLVRYRSEQQQNKLASLLREYEELMMADRSRRRIGKETYDPLKKRIIVLENELHKSSIVQMEADMVRKKYRCVRSGLKSDGAIYASALENLKGSIDEQKREIERLEGVKKEASKLGDVTRAALAREELEALNTSKERDCVILDYRQRVEDRKLELERLERMIFPGTVSTRPLPLPLSLSREELNLDRAREEGIETGGLASTIAKTSTARIGSSAESSGQTNGNSENSTWSLEESFAKLRCVTGVTRRNDLVLDRFLGQRATKERLQAMRTATENEKMLLERRRQQLTAEIEMHKFSETKDADQNLEEAERLTGLIRMERHREERAEAEARRVQALSSLVVRTLYRFAENYLEKNTLSSLSDEEQSEVVVLLEKSIGAMIKRIATATDRTVDAGRFGLEGESTASDKLDSLSIGTCASADGKDSRAGSSRTMRTNEDRSLFPRFPILAPATSAAPTPLSDDDEDIPTRTILKRQAQLLVDTKSRRKPFNFRR
ncbi:myosin heavy chain, striated muscle [Cephus cinctus]|uniref:Myosin heavy chain, striated muscle n=1 Tax=Cephus cinctus TaxID=211228 RepID=A0AAJ7BTD3_CEPCN|nr:myosin heavy chain, striated muscle [Cephus cinctus]